MIPMRWVWVGVAVSLVVSGACRSEADRARDQFTVRLQQPGRLTPLELTHLMDEADQAIAGKKMRVQAGSVTHEAGEKDRDEVIALLRNQTSVEDGGLRAENGTALRGIAGPATPLNSELEAVGTVWIDVRTFLPRRYELTYGQAGAGDYTYDITW